VLACASANRILLLNRELFTSAATEYVYARYLLRVHVRATADGCIDLTGRASWGESRIAIIDLGQACLGCARISCVLPFTLHASSNDVRTCSGRIALAGLSNPVPPHACML
jgi:hypothetical protein